MKIIVSKRKMKGAYKINSSDYMQYDFVLGVPVKVILKNKYCKPIYIKQIK